LLYPGVWALALHRPAHVLWQGKFDFFARLINHFAAF
jgi:serine O-acetyltransferase